MHFPNNVRVYGLLLALPLLTAVWVFIIGEGVFEKSRIPSAVLIYSFDAARWDIFPQSCGGQVADDEMPSLTRFCRSAKVFRRAYSTATSTWPSMATIYTGLEPTQHHVGYRRLYLSPGFVTLAEVYRQTGYRTLVVSANRGIFSPRTNLGQGFDKVITHLPQQYISGLPMIQKDQEVLHRLAFWNPYVIVRLAVESMGDHCPLCLVHTHVIQPHAPYQAPLPVVHMLAPWMLTRKWKGHFIQIDERGYVSPSEPLLKFIGRNYRYPRMDSPGMSPQELRVVHTLYKAAMVWGEQAFGAMMRWLENQPWSSNTLVVVTADHGEMLGEHGYWMHANTAHEPTVHVPLIIRIPGEPPGFRDDLVSLRDLYATLVRQIHPDKSVIIPEGSLDLFSKRNRLQRRWAFAFANNNVMVRFDRYKLLYTPESKRAELYDIASDPNETHDILPYHIGLGQQLFELYQNALYKDMQPHASPGRDMSGFDPVQELRALGYIDLVPENDSAEFRIASNPLDPDKVKYYVVIQQEKSGNLRIRLTNTGVAAWPATSSDKGAVQLLCTLSEGSWSWTGTLEKDLYPNQSITWEIPPPPEEPQCRLIQVGFHEF